MAVITKIEQQKKNKNRYSVFIDDEYSFSVFEDTLVKHRLQKGMTIEKDELDQVLELEELNLCINYGLNLLSFKARSQYELIDKMKSKEYKQDCIEEAIKYLKKYNYINDSEYAKAYVKDKVNFKNLGQIRIKNELYQKRVDKTIVEDILGELINSEDEYERALELAKKKIDTTYRNDDKQAAYRKLGGFLQRRGYPMDVVIKVLKKVLKD